MKAFIGESMARNRYTMYAKIAKKEGYEKLSEIFLLTAENEREHGKWIFRMINDIKKKRAGQNPEENLEEITVEASGPTILGTSIDNLKSAIAGEHYEHSSMYPLFADTAEKQGYSDIAKRLRAIATAELHHEQRYKELLEKVETGTVLKKDEPVVWVCRKCGYVHQSTEPPDECPSCSHPKQYFEVKCEKY